MTAVAAIVLAAGRGIRFGAEPKLLASLGSRPLVRHVVEAAVGSSVRPVIVVTGYRAAEIAAALAGLPIQVVHNVSFADGMSTSLKAGFAALPREAKAAVILLGDMPLMTPGLIENLVSGWNMTGKPAALVPTFNGRRGNPVVVSRELEDAIEGLSADVGAGPILRGRSDVLEWPIADRAILQDVDTMEDFGQLLG
jgi:molybdenum cofactor cytidylyltransferase